MVLQICITEASNEVLDFECRCKGEEKSNEATHVLVLMVRGLFSSLHFVIVILTECKLFNKDNEKVCSLYFSYLFYDEIKLCYTYEQMSVPVPPSKKIKNTGVQT